MSKCIGCGANLQNTNKEDIGYTTCTIQKRYIT